MPQRKTVLESYTLLHTHAHTDRLNEQTETAMSVINKQTDDNQKYNNHSFVSVS